MTSGRSYVVVYKKKFFVKKEITRKDKSVATTQKEVIAIRQALSSATPKDKLIANWILIGVTLLFSVFTVYAPVALAGFSAVPNPFVKGIVFTSMMWTAAALLGIVTMRFVGVRLDRNYKGFLHASNTPGFHKYAALAGFLTALFVSLSTGFATSVTPVVGAALSGLIVLFVVPHDLKTGAISSEKRLHVYALLIVSIGAAILLDVGSSLKLSLIALPVLGLIANYIRSHAEVLEQKGACLCSGISIQFAFARVAYAAIFSTLFALVIGFFYHDVFRMYMEVVDWKNLLSVVAIAACFKFADYGRIYAKSVASVVLGLIIISSAPMFVLLFNYPAALVWGKLIPGSDAELWVWLCRIVGVLVIVLCIFGINFMHNKDENNDHEEVAPETRS